MIGPSKFEMFLHEGKLKVNNYSASLSLFKEQRNEWYYRSPISVISKDAS